MFTNTDFDKLKQLMEESEENRQLITRLLDSHKESVSMITHEIRNPLTMVYSSLQLIENSHPEVRTFQHWEALHEDVVFMTELLADLSAYNNGSALRLKTLDTTSFLRRVALSYASSIADSSLEFTSRIDPNLPSIAGDATKLKEVFFNLLKNAAEAFPPDTAGRIRLEASVKGESSDSPSVRILIQDSGCGIPKERLKDIFEPFTTYKSGGTGLGLPLSKRIIESHGGSLQVSSLVRSGTTFTILLPASSSSGTE